VWSTEGTNALTIEPRIRINRLVNENAYCVDLNHQVMRNDFWLHMV
jgi:hypothetical protein